MIRNAAKIKLVDEAEWSNPFATIASAKNGRLRVHRSLTSGVINDWHEKQQEFQVFPRSDGAFVRFKPHLLGVASLATSVLGDFFNPEYYHPVISETQDERTPDRILSVSFPLFTSTERVGEEVEMKNYRHITMTELAGSGLYALFSTIHQYGIDNLLSFQCHDDPPRSLQQITIPRIN